MLTLRQLLIICAIIIVAAYVCHDNGWISGDITALDTFFNDNNHIGK